MAGASPFASVIVVPQDNAGILVVTQDNPAITMIMPVSQAPYAYSSLSGLPVLGTAAALNVGTLANQVVQLDGSARLPPVDGSQLSNLPLLPRGLNCGRLVQLNGTTISFTPYRGNLIQINGLVYQIPSAGVTASNASLLATTVYFVYAYINGATMTLELSTTGHATSTTAGNVGTEIKTGDDSRTLVGMIRTNGTSNFVDAAAQRWVASWFNRRTRIAVSPIDTVSSTTSSSIVQFSNVKAEFVCWSDETIFQQFTGAPANSTNTGYFGVQNGMDGVSIGTELDVNPVGISTRTPMVVPWASQQSEGYHWTGFGLRDGSATGATIQVTSYGGQSVANIIP